MTNLGLAIAALAAFLGVGCATYGFADRPGPAVTTVPVAVQTVDVDASFGTDPSHLTEQLVEALRREGVVHAKWTTEVASGGVVRCDITADDESFGNAIRVLASARCTLDGEEVAVRSGDAQMTVSPTQRSRERGRAIEMAGTRALSAAATDVASAIRRRLDRVTRGT